MVSDALDSIYTSTTNHIPAASLPKRIRKSENADDPPTRRARTTRRRRRNMKRTKVRTRTRSPPRKVQII